MTTIERLRELEMSATEAPWDATPNPMRSDGKFLTHGPERPYDPPNSHLKQLPDSIFMGQGKPEDVDLIAATRNALPAMLAVIEAAEELADGVDCNDHCLARGGGACTCGMEALAGKVYSALAAFREVRE